MNNMMSITADPAVETAVKAVYETMFGRKLSDESWEDKSGEGPDGLRVSADQRWFWDLEAKQTRTIEYSNVAGEQHTLYAYYLPARDNNGNIKKNAPLAVIYHGITNRSRMMGYIVKMFHEQGMHVLVPDLRGHGRNDEPACSQSIVDGYDCVTWVSNIAKELSFTNLYIYGVSLGGAVATKGAAELEKTNDYKGRVRLIIDATTPDMVSGVMMLFNQVSSWSNLSLSQKIQGRVLLDELLKSKQGFTLSEGLNLFETLSNQAPLLIIHGVKDSLIPYQISEFVYRANQSPIKSSFFVEDANHPQAMWYEYDNYHSKVNEFIQVTS